MKWAQSTAAPTESCTQGCTPGAVAELLLMKQGCTYPKASNYDATAKLDDGSCAYTTEASPPDVYICVCVYIYIHIVYMYTGLGGWLLKPDLSD